jgi:gamma-tubulin complex component 2
VSVAEMLRRVLPMCSAYVRVNAFVAERDRFEFGLVSHALCAAIFALLKVGGG